MTAPLSARTILPGVVRKSILELAATWGDVKVVERNMTMKELLSAKKEGRVSNTVICIQ